MSFWSLSLVTTMCLQVEAPFQPDQLVSNVLERILELAQIHQLDQRLDDLGGLAPAMDASLRTDWSNKNSQEAVLEVQSMKMASSSKLAGGRYRNSLHWTDKGILDWKSFCCDDFRF